MIGAIVAALDEDNLLVTPSGNIAVEELIGRKARYLDKSGKVWPATVMRAEDPSVIIKFDRFPTGLGQGQIVDIMEEGDDENEFKASG